MKNINRLLAAAAILLSAAACHTSEIDNPGHTDPVNPGESGLSITANIVKTRVTYNDRDEGYLDQQWDEGDILFGYYDGKVTNRVILKVDYLDPEDDYNAILIPVECVGVATLKDLADLKGGVNVDLVYTGKNIEDFCDNPEGIVAALFGSNLDGPLTVDLSSQDGIRIPACMHARAPIVVDEDDENKKSLFFKFVNDCAIIEIESLTGITEEGVLSSVAISSLFPYGKYTLGADGFSFEGVGDITSQDISLCDGWKVNNEGVVTYNNEPQPILIAVVPISEDDYEEDSSDGINVAASITGVSPAPSFTYSKNTLQCGCCYVISKREVVARTADGQCFATVAEAFERAKQLSGTYPTAETNVVTLIKDHIEGLGEHPDAVLVEDETPEDETDDSYWDASLMVEIDYDVTLDLNGCTLSLIDADVDGDDTSECFYVDAYVEDETGEGHLTIKDSRSGGTIESGANSHIIINEGKVTIMGGRIKQTMETNGWCAVRNYGELNVSDGAVLYSYSFYAISNDSSVTIDDGSISAYSSSAIRNGEDGELTINDGKVYSSSSGYAVENKGILSVNGGEVYTNGAGSAIKSDANPGAIVTIGGTENNASGPYIHNDSYDFPAIYIIGPTTTGTKVTFTMNQGLVYGSSCAILISGKVNGYIKGGYIASGFRKWGEGQTSSFSAITLQSGVLSCEISGGKIISGKYGLSSVACDAASATLSIIWDGDNRLEPILYSDGSYGESVPTIKVTGAISLNICGGLIYNADTDSPYFLTTNSSRVTINVSDFYSNKSAYKFVALQKDLTKDEDDKKIINANAINIKDVYSIEESELTLYHINPPAKSSSAPAGTSNYYFDSFDW